MPTARRCSSHRVWLAWLVAAGLATAAGAGATGGSSAAPAANYPVAQPRATAPKVRLGIDVLAAENFAPLRGQRVGLLTNPAGVNRFGVSTIDVLRQAPGVNLVALYGPEHGMYGNETAGTPVQNKIDPRTHLPVFSLYGSVGNVSYRKPTPDMLKGIDVMVVDLQDIGARSYTYISCLRKTMEACFEQNKTVVVLDRPNPLGGLKVGGPLLEDPWISYVGEYRIPYVYGLTIGELARIAKDNPGWLDLPDDVRARGRLLVVPMSGWRRSMLWPDTGLRWVATSPSIPDIASAFGYSLTGLGVQLGQFKQGFGTPYAFRLLNYEGKTPEALAATLRGLRLTGLDFRPLTYKDDKGAAHSGVYVFINDWNAVDPTELSFDMMKLAAAWDPGKPFASLKGDDANLYEKLVGSSAWIEEISTKGGQADVAGFFRRWDADDAAFQQWSKKWWLYGE